MSRVVAKVSQHLDDRLRYHSLDPAGPHRVLQSLRARLMWTLWQEINR
jgi:hypothetical protein